MTTNTVENQQAGEPTQWVFEASYRVYYNTKDPVPIKEIISSLQGLEGLLQWVPQALTNLTGIEIDGSQFLVQTIKSGSLVDDFLLKFFFKDKESFEAFAQKLGENKKMRAAVIAAIVAGAVGYGLHWAATASKQPTPSITATNSVIIQNGAGVLNISPEVFQEKLLSALSDRKAVAASAIKVVSPARSDPTSTIRFGTQEDAATTGLEIPASAIAEAPTKLTLEPNERIEKYTSAVLQLRAMNLDSKTSGWAGKLANREERLPIELDPNVSASEIFGRDSVIVDADLVFTESGRSRELKPKRIYVRRVIPKS